MCTSGGSKSERIQIDCLQCLSNSTTTKKKTNRENEVKAKENHKRRKFRVIFFPPKRSEKTERKARTHKQMCDLRVLESNDEKKLL